MNNKHVSSTISVKILVNDILPAKSVVTYCRKKLSTASSIFFPSCFYPCTQSVTHNQRTQLPTTLMINHPLPAQPCINYPLLTQSSPITHTISHPPPTQTAVDSAVQSAAHSGCKAAMFPTNCGIIGCHYRKTLWW